MRQASAIAFDNTQPVRSQSRPEGLAYASFAAFLISVCSLMSKLCCYMPAGQLYNLGSIFLLISSGLWLLFTQQNPFPRGRRTSLLLYSFTATQASMSSYQAIRLLPLSDEALLAYSSIPLTSFLACWYLGESCGLSQIISCFLIFGGLFMVCQPGLDRQNYPYYALGVVVAVYSASCDSISYLMIKRVVDLPTAVITLNLSITACLSSSLLSLYETWIVPTSIRAVLSFSSMFVMYEMYITLAMNSEKAGLVALVQATDIAFAYMWETLYFREAYNALKIIGSVLIMCVVCFNVIFNNK